MINSILLTIPNFRTAGSQHVVLDLYKNYKKSGKTVFVLIEDQDGNFPDGISENDRQVIHKTGYLDLLSGIKYIGKFSRLLNSHKIDVVHSWDYRSEIWEAVACKIRRVPYVYTKKNNAWSKKWWMKSMLTTHIVYDHPEMQQRFFNQNTLKNKASFIPHGIDIDLFSKTNPSKKPSGIIGCIGNIGENKNQLLILKALAECNLNIRCAFYGNKDENYFSVLKRFVSENKLDERVEFHDYVSNDQLPEIIQSLDIMILASYNEGLPVTLMESIACGTYCMASESGGGTRYIFEVCGTGDLFDPTNHHQLSRLIENYYSNVEEKELIALKAIEKVKETFSSLNEASKYLQLFNQITE